MKTLVSGGAGFVGSTLVDSLLDQGHKVTVIDNLSTGKQENINSKVEDCIIANVEDISLQLVGKFDVIFHLAALARIQPSFKEPLKTYLNNSVGTMKVLELARETGVKVVYAGSSSAYHDVFANPYSYSKWLGEQHCQLYSKVYNVSVSIARFFNVYGKRQISEGAYATVIGVFEKQKKEGLPLTVTGTGEKRRDFTHVSDICDGLIAMSQNDWDGEIFQLGTGRNYSINEVATMFGGPIQYIPDRPGEAQVTLADISHAQEKLGYKPKYVLEDYINSL